MVKDRVLFVKNQEQDMVVHNRHCYSAWYCQTRSKERRIKKSRLRRRKSLFTDNLFVKLKTIKNSIYNKHTK